MVNLNPYVVDYPDVVRSIQRNELRKIIVTGPQRSGTHIGAAVLAHELDLLFLKEQEVGIHNLTTLFWHLTHTPAFVLQAPGLAAHVRRFGREPGVGVVFMRRPAREVNRSKCELGWLWSRDEEIEWSQYGPIHAGACLTRFEVRMWKMLGRPSCQYAFDLRYASLAQHPLWVPREERVSAFVGLQTAAGGSTSSNGEEKRSD